MSTVPAVAPAPAGPHGLRVLVPALGVTQIVSWGSLHYAIAVLAAPMAQDFGVDVALVLAAYTGGLLASGASAGVAGRWIDRLGGSRVMSAGSVLAALALGLMAWSPHVVVFMVAWLLAGVAMSATLYDPAFATLSQVAGDRYRGAVTALTLFGGLASTAFWPLTHLLNEQWGWRDTLWAYAALQLVLCLPLHALLLPGRTPASPGSPAARATVPAAARAPRHPGLVWLGVSFGLGAIVFSALSVHLLATLQSRGLTPGEAIAVSVLVGPMQVLGRIVEFAGARQARAVTVGFVAMGVMLVALLLLGAVQGAGLWAWAFAALYGASNGVMTIVRGTVPAELYGREGYGSLLGRLAAPAFAGKALAPVAFALLADAAGHGVGVWVLVGMAALSLGAYGQAVRQARLGALAPQAGMRPGSEPE